MLPVTFVTSLTPQNPVFHTIFAARKTTMQKCSAWQSAQNDRSGPLTLRYTQKLSRRWSRRGVRVIVGTAGICSTPCPPTEGCPCVCPGSCVSGTAPPIFEAGTAGTPPRSGECAVCLPLALPLFCPLASLMLFPAPAPSGCTLLRSRGGSVFCTRTLPSGESTVVFGPATGEPVIDNGLPAGDAGEATPPGLTMPLPPADVGCFPPKMFANETAERETW